MNVAVEYGEQRLEFEVPDERVAGVWRGPSAVAAPDVKGLVLEGLEHPLSFPPLRQMVVPGDRVVIALDQDVPEIPSVVDAVVQTLQGAGVEPSDIQVLAAGPSRAGSDWTECLPPGVTWALHSPQERGQIAYLANTPRGRRVYLNRALTDADCVIPIGRLGYDPVFGYRGPWGVIFPGLSDSETQGSFRAQASVHPPDRSEVRAALAEAADVSWLLGSQFQLGIVAGVGGLARLIAGLDAAVRSEGMVAVDLSWGYQVDERAELVIVGIGRPGAPTTIDDLALGLATAARLVQRGGKIVALSHATGPIGPAVRSLTDAGEPRPDSPVLRGLQHAIDYPAALQLAHTLAWADVYLLSSLDETDVEDLAMVALGRPEDARKLAARSASCLFVSQAEWTRADTAGDSK